MQWPKREDRRPEDKRSMEAVYILALRLLRRLRRLRALRRRKMCLTERVCCSMVHNVYVYIGRSNGAASCDVVRYCQQ